MIVAYIVYNLLPTVLLLFSIYIMLHMRVWLDGLNMVSSRKRILAIIYIVCITLLLAPWGFIKKYYGFVDFLYNYGEPNYQYYAMRNYIYIGYIVVLSQLMFCILLLVYDFLYIIWFFFKKAFFKFLKLKNKYSVKMKSLFYNSKFFRKKGKYDRYRRSFIKYSLFSVPGSILTFNAVNIFGASDDFIINKKDIRISRLDPKLKGFTITHISDFHFGLFMDIYKFKNLFLEHINNLNSDIIVITGDLIDRHIDIMPMVIKSVKMLKAKLGVYACPGNHDYYARSVKSLSREFSNLNGGFLKNDNVTINYNGAQINLMGLDYTFSQGPLSYSKGITQSFIIDNNINSIFSKLKNPNLVNIMLSHSPGTFNNIKKSDHNIDITLCGHTHGGQIVLSMDGDEKYSLAKNFYYYVKGYYKFNNKHIYVNSGLGHWVPIRINCPVEITQITLA